VSISVEALATDSVDAMPQVQMWHNGIPYAPGSAISAIGVHAVSVRSVDASGNQTIAAQVFEIRRRRGLQAAVHVSELQTTLHPAGFIAAVWGQVRVSSSHFDAKQIHPGTLNVWFGDEAGRWTRIARDEFLRLDYEDCHYVIEFATDLSASLLAKLPPNLIVTGRGGQGTAGGEFDFVTVTEARVPPWIFVPPCDDPVPPEQPDPAPCQWRYEPPTGPAQSCTWANYSFVGGANGSASVMAMWVTRTTVAGSGNCWVDAAILASVYSSCSKTNSGTFQVFLEGEDCCTDCTMHVVASPQVTGNGVLNPTGSFNVSSSISVGVQGTGASASGSVTLSSESGGTQTVNGITIPIPAGQTMWSYSAIAGPPLDQNFQTCNLSVTIALAGTIDTTAATSWFDSYGQATGTFGTATPGLTITPRENCEGEEGEPIIIDHGMP
jgi:hypothetical protein